jgi:hypothetical protein
VILAVASSVSTERRDASHRPSNRHRCPATDGERMFDFQIHGGTSERGNNDVMVYSYSFRFCPV